MTIDCCLDWPEISPITGPCIRPGGAALTERAIRICRLPAGSRIADIGCGAGGTLEYLERKGAYRLTGLDYSESLLEEAVLRLKAGRLVRGSAAVLPFKNRSFDALFCECVLSILDDRGTTLLGFDRVLKEGGFLVVSDVFSQFGTARMKQETTTAATAAERPLTREDIWGSLENLGFSLLLWEEHKRLLKEFVARMILAGERLPDSWQCGQTKAEKGADRSGMSYFLLVARKDIALPSDRNTEKRQGQ